MKTTWRERIKARADQPRRGQGLVEMAVLMPVLVLILLGALDLGRAYIYATRLNNAVKEAAMTGLYQPNLATVRNRAYREVTDPNILPSQSDDRYLLGEPGVDFVIDQMYRYKASGIRYSCIPTPPTPPETTLADCVSPAPGDAIEVSGYYIFRPITSEILRFLPTDLRFRKTVRAGY